MMNAMIKPKLDVEGKNLQSDHEFNLRRETRCVGFE